MQSGRPIRDTIVAIVTAPGRAAVGILRLSGPRAAAIGGRICGREFSVGDARRAVLCDFRDDAGEVVDRGLAIYFPAPRSFTGEEVVELQGHGGTIVMGLLLTTALAAGARLARPGEFSERAFLNGRMDLVQAEAIADLIDAGSAAAARAASRSLHGEFSRAVEAIVEALIGLRADLEAALDFSDEADVPWLDPQRLRRRIADLEAALADVRRRAGQGRRLRDGLTVAIVGAPNVGKSTLLNALSGADSAIVSPIAGTTRDVLREHVEINGLPVTLIDTAGLRETSDPIEAEGVRRARAALVQAELALFVMTDDLEDSDTDSGLLVGVPPQLPVVVLHNKCDLSGRAPQRFLDERGRVHLRLAVATGAGLDLLRTLLFESAGIVAAGSGTFSARARHLQALDVASGHLSFAADLASDHGSSELTAEELRLAQQALDEITGRFTSEDLLGRIFSSFCLGK